jgi:hypothetical protein
MVLLEVQIPEVVAVLLLGVVVEQAALVGLV